MKKIISMLLAIVMIVTVIPLTESGIAKIAVLVHAEENTGGKCGDNVNWSFNTNTGVLTISGTGPMDDFDDWDTPWYYSMHDIESVVINEGVTSIGDNAFSCYEISDVYIPNSVTTIGKDAFEDGTLKSLKIGKGVSFIDKYAFSYCEITDLYLFDIAKWCNIEFANEAANPIARSENVYLKNELMENLVFPEGTTVIPESIFQHCDTIKTLTIPKTLIKIEKYAFYGCNHLTTVILSGNLTEIGDEAFCCCKKLCKVTFPDTLLKIGDNAFFLL